MEEPEHLDLEFLDLQGTDRQGRRILRVVGKSIPGKAVSPEVLLERVLQSVTEALEDTDSELSLVYFHAGFQWAQNCPSLHWLQQLFARLPEAFFQRLARVLVVHPTVGLRAALFLVGPWMPQSFRSLYSKVEFVSRVEFMDECVDISSEIAIPESVLEHDRALEQHPLMDYGIQFDPVLARAQVVGDVSTSELIVQKGEEET